MTPEQRIERLEYQMAEILRNREDIGSRTFIDKDLHVNGTIFLNGVSIRTGVGAPTTDYDELQGSLYLRTDGDVVQSLYVKYNATSWDNVN